MKRIYFLYTIVISLLCVVSCSTEEKQVRQAAMGYLDAMANYRFDDAYAYASKITRDTTLPFITNKLMPMVDSSFLAKNTPATVVIDDVAFLNDTAWVSYKKTTPIKTLNNTIYLIKEQDRWVVDVVLQLPKKISIGGNGQQSVEYNDDPDGTEMEKLEKVNP